MFTKNPPRLSVTSRDLANYLNCMHVGEEISVAKPSSPKNAQTFSLVFVKSDRPDLLDLLRDLERVTVITDAAPSSLPLATVILSSNPRLSFSQVVRHFFSVPKEQGVHPSAVIEDGAIVGTDVSVGPYSVIGSDVVLGQGVEIGAHVVISGPTQIGSRSKIRSHSVIGDDGFGFEFDDRLIPQRVPHIGGVEIGEDVEIGSMVVIARGTLDNTIIGSHTKIDDHVFIAHNVSVGRSSLVIAAAQISGSVFIGSNAWIGPQSCIKDGVVVGRHATIGIGSTVIHDVPDDTVVAGNPARILRRKDT